MLCVPQVGVSCRGLAPLSNTSRCGLGQGRSGWFGFGVGEFLFPSFKQKVFQGFVGNALHPVGPPPAGDSGQGRFPRVRVYACVFVRVRACARIGYITI